MCIAENNVNIIPANKKSETEMCNMFKGYAGSCKFIAKND